MTMKNESKTKMTALMALLIFGAFALCALLVLLTGADIYKKITEREEKSFDSRSVPQYISTRFRQGDSMGAIRVNDFGGTDALEITQQINEKDYVTRVYCFDGYLCELFTNADGDFSPEDGEQLLPLKALEIEMEESCFIADITYLDGKTSRLILHQRSFEEVDG